MPSLAWYEEAGVLKDVRGPDGIEALANLFLPSLRQDQVFPTIGTPSAEPHAVDRCAAAGDLIPVHRLSLALAFVADSSEPAFVVHFDEVPYHRDRLIVFASSSAAPRGKPCHEARLCRPYGLAFRPGEHLEGDRQLARGPEQRETAGNTRYLPV